MTPLASASYAPPQPALAPAASASPPPVNHFSRESMDVLTAYRIAPYVSPADLARISRTSKNLQTYAELAAARIPQLRVGNEPPGYRPRGYYCQVPQIDAAKMDWILTRYTHLRDLELSSCCTANTEVLQSLVRNVASTASLRRVVLPWLSTGHIWIEQDLVEAFLDQRNWSELEHLDASETFFKVNREMLAALSARLQTAEKLQNLVLKAEEDARADYIQMLPPSLQTLYVDSVNNVDVCKALIKKFDAPHRFTRIHMGIYLDFAKESAPRFYAALFPHLALLQGIWLEMSEIEPAMIEPICKYLKQNGVLQEFYLDAVLRIHQTVTFLNAMPPQVREVTLDTHRWIKDLEQSQILHRCLQFPPSVSVSVLGRGWQYTSRQVGLDALRRMYRDRQLSDSEEKSRVLEHMPIDEIVTDYRPRLHEIGISDAEIEQMVSKVQNGLELIRNFDRQLANASDGERFGASSGPAAASAAPPPPSVEEEFPAIDPVVEAQVNSLVEGSQGEKP